MDFRVAKIADLDALNRLERELFVGDRIAPRQMKRFIQSEHAVLLVADNGQQLAGYALYFFIKEHNSQDCIRLPLDLNFGGRRLLSR